MTQTSNGYVNQVLGYCVIWNLAYTVANFDYLLNVNSVLFSPIDVIFVPMTWKSYNCLASGEVDEQLKM